MGGNIWSARQGSYFVYPGKSKKNKYLDVVQQLLNAYFDRCLAIDHAWEYHPLATGIKESGLRADFRKTFSAKDSITVQAEIQFGNMALWYSDIFKFQACLQRQPDSDWVFRWCPCNL